MLKGRASTFYYNYLVKKGYKFNRIIYKIRYYFKIKRDYFFKNYCYKPRYLLT